MTQLLTDPVYQRMAQKLTEPAARKALMRNGQPDRPPEAPKEGHMRWAAEVTRHKFVRPLKEKERNAILQQNNGRKIIGGKNGNNIKNLPDPKEIDIYEVSAPNQNYPDTKPRATMWEAPGWTPAGSIWTPCGISIGKPSWSCSRSARRTRAPSSGIDPKSAIAGRPCP